MSVPSAGILRLCLVASFLVAIPSATRAQDVNPGAVPAPNLLAAAITSASSVDIASTPRAKTSQRLFGDRGVLVPLYAGFTALQMLDAHSTVYAVDRGAVERNPLVRGLAHRPPLFVATKMTVAFSTIVAAEHLRHRNRMAAILTMAAMNSAYAAVVIHNYRAQGGR